MREPAISRQEQEQAGPARRRADPLALVLCAALSLSLFARVKLGWSLPLWFDEVYTGTIAGQRDVAGLVRWCLSEITGPAFYMPMWLWAKVAGTGTVALRLPALLLSVAAPLLIAWRGHADRRVRLYWATFSALWLPLLPLATEARPYPQLFFLGALQAIVFLRFARVPDLRRALEWTSVTALFVLTNYYALVISGFEALALVAMHRRALLKLYPALAPLLAAGAWMVFHVPVVLRFAAEHGSQFEHLPLIGVLGAPWFLFGPGIQAFLVLGLLAFTHSSWWRKGAKLSPEAQLVWAGVATFALIFAAGLFRAVLAPRYVTPGIPAVLFGLGCWASGVRFRKPEAVAAMLGVFFFATAATLVTGSSDQRFRDRADLEFETASSWLMKEPLDRLYYLKPEPSPAPARDAEIAGFFFARAGRPLSVIQEDYRTAMTPRLGSDGRAGVLFIGDSANSARLTAWIQSQPAGWTCRNFGQTAFAIMACRPMPRRSPQAR